MTSSANQPPRLVRSVIVFALLVITSEDALGFNNLPFGTDTLEPIPNVVVSGEKGFDRLCLVPGPEQQPKPTPTPLPLVVVPLSRRRACITTTLLLFFSSKPLLPARAVPTTSTIQQSSWTLGNGQVDLPIPLSIGPLQQLNDPILLGSGGGGAVFAMKNVGDSDSKVAVKISWESTTQSVANECQILQILQANQVSGVEQCLGSANYPTIEKEEKRIMIALQPVVEDPVVNSIQDLPSTTQQIRAVQQVIQTMVQMLQANVVTTDVQFLLTTKRLLFIDFTEAQILSQPPTFLQLALCTSFISEMLAIIPTPLEAVASKAMDQELQQANNILLQAQVKEILKEQVPFLSQESIHLLDKSS